jgi:8-oxo-dGTP pyrophosphatase MutT (NUDIX family)
VNEASSEGQPSTHDDELAAPPKRQVAVGLIVADDGPVLLQLRDDRPGLPGAGQWGFFGGHLEPGERPAEAFLREMDEELGWRPKHFEHYLTTTVDRGGWHVVSHVFAAHLDVSVDQLTLGEGQAMRLFDPNALPEDIPMLAAYVITSFAQSDACRRVRKSWDWITATALLVDREGRFLLQHRDDKPGIANPGMWGSFGGRIEPYETPDDGFLRELQEELAWQPSKYELYSAVGYRPKEDRSRRNLVYVYSALVNVPTEQLVLGEGQGMALFATDALPEAIVPELRVLIEEFVASVAYRQLLEPRE